jgi:hypothetical protein
LKCHTTKRRKRAMTMEREHFDRGEKSVPKWHKLTTDEIKKFEFKSLKLEETLATYGNLQPKKLKHNVQKRDQKKLIPYFITYTPMNNRSMRSLSKKKCKKKLQSWQWFWNRLKNIIGPTQKSQSTPKEGAPQRHQRLTMLRNNSINSCCSA